MMSQKFSTHFLSYWQCCKTIFFRMFLAFLKPAQHPERFTLTVHFCQWADLEKMGQEHKMQLHSFCFSIFWQYWDPILYNIFKYFFSQFLKIEKDKKKFSFLFVLKLNTWYSLDSFKKNAFSSVKTLIFDFLVKKILDLVVRQKIGCISPSKLGR